MIILHNPHDKDSRDFVEKYGQDNIILEYPECIETYPYTSAFPSVIINVPGYNVLEHTDELDPTMITPQHNVEAKEEIFRSKEDPCDPDEFWKEIQEYIEMVTQRAQENPII